MGEVVYIEGGGEEVAEVAGMTFIGASQAVLDTVKKREEIANTYMKDHGKVLEELDFNDVMTIRNLPEWIEAGKGNPVNVIVKMEKE